jgi:hypothetical protein
MEKLWDGRGEASFLILQAIWLHLSFCWRNFHYHLWIVWNMVFTFLLRVRRVWVGVEVKGFIWSFFPLSM